MTKTVLRACHLCEASCGLEIDVEGTRVTAVRPDYGDPISKGYVCPKGLAIGDLHNDPDRLRTPMRRDADGRFRPVGWDEAFELAAARLGAIRKTHGADAVAVYFGNPLVHNLGGVLMIGALGIAVATLASFRFAGVFITGLLGAVYFVLLNLLRLPEELR